MAKLSATQPKGETTNNIDGVEKAFYRNLGNGVLACQNLRDMVYSTVKSRDTTVIARAIRRAKNDKKDDQAAAAVRVVCMEVWPGMKLTLDTNGIPTMKIKGIEHDLEALKRLDEAVERKLSIRHATFRKVVRGADQEAPEFNPALVAERFGKKHTLVEVRSLIAALQAVAKELDGKEAAKGGEEDK